MKKTVFVAALAAWVMSAANAQTSTEPRVVAAADFCSKMPVPRWPLDNGSATYEVQALVRNGRVVSADIRTVKANGLDRKGERAVKNEIFQTLRFYVCKADGEYTIEQTMELPSNR